MTADDHDHDSPTPEPRPHYFGRKTFSACQAHVTVGPQQTSTDAENVAQVVCGHGQRESSTGNATAAEAAEFGPLGIVCSRCRTTNPPESSYCLSCRSFLPRNSAALTAGVRSRAVINTLALAAHEIAAQITADRDPDTPTIPQRLIEAFSQTTTMRAAVFERMNGEPITNKGMARRMLAAYLALVDRELRLAQAIGIERHVQQPSSRTITTVERVVIDPVA
jgi:hypothetical protein